MDDFALALEKKFSPYQSRQISGLHGAKKLSANKNYQLKSRRIWMTDIYTCKFFNEFVRDQIKNDLMKGNITNGMSGSSWISKKFERITMILSKFDKKYIVS